MEFVNQRPYADPAVAARNLLEIANARQKNLCLQYYANQLPRSADWPRSAFLFLHMVLCEPGITCE
jgi:hypothetical protein